MSVDLFIPPAQVNPFPPSSFLDNGFTIKNHTDTSKAFVFDASGISAATTRSYVMPDKNGTVALTSDLVGLWDDRGNWDPTSRVAPNNYPNSNGSGTAGAILKGDTYTISVAGTLGTTVVSIGDVVRALTDTPGDTASNWSILAMDSGNYVTITGIQTVSGAKTFSAVTTFSNSTLASGTSTAGVVLSGGISAMNGWFGGTTAASTATSSSSGYMINIPAATWTDSGATGARSVWAGIMVGQVTITSNNAKSYTIVAGGYFDVPVFSNGGGATPTGTRYGIYVNSGATYLGSTLAVAATTDSGNTATGCATFAGGIGVAKNINGAFLGVSTNASATGFVTIGAGTTSVASILHTSGTLNTGTLQSGAQEYASNHFITNSSLNRGPIGFNLIPHFATVNPAVADGTQQTLYTDSYTNLLSGDGDAVEFSFSVSYTTAAFAKIFQVSYGGVLLTFSSLTTVTGSAIIHGYFIRDASGTVKGAATLSGATVALLSVSNAGSVTNGGANALTLSVSVAAGGSTATATANFGKSWYHPTRV